MEKRTCKLDAKRWKAFILTSIIPICLCILILKIINVKLLFGLFSAIRCLLLVGTFLICNFFVIRTDTKVVKKIFSWIVLIIVYAFLTVISLFLTTNINKISYYDEKALNYYNENLLDIPVFSFVPDLGDYKSIECHHMKYHQSIFQTETNVLVCQYDEDEYEKIKTSFEKNLILETDIFIYETSESYIETLPQAYLGAYHFQLLDSSFKEYKIYYPRYIALIVTNDTT